MKLAVLGSLAAVATAVVANDQYQQNEDHYEEIIPEDEDPFTSRSLANSPVPLPVLAMLTMMNFFNALQEDWSEEDGRDGDLDSNNPPGRFSSVWKRVKGVPGVLYETSSMMAPLTLRYMLSEDSDHPHCQQVMLCELNVKVKQRFGKPGEIAMQLASSMAGYALGGKDAQRYDSLVDAARNGRRGKECHELYPKCPARNESSAVPALLNLASRLIKN
ncbi:hypothetical protein GHT06_014614 [Daphnia sinensis]|uniref:Uncharacterized protein n=1 Tax=Daphnia sinensis TaxID=1820382 RepID=A0AAD5PU30_9CRUS|nr:hypothetical protein GHT06_014614 [Daphnia sinensis]